MANKLPGGFQIDAVRSLLGPRPLATDLEGAFDWGSSPQGYDFWQAQWVRMCTGQGLAPGALAQLEKWVRAYGGARALQAAVSIMKRMRS